MKKKLLECIYWILSFTWGIIPSVIGFIVAFSLWITCKSKTHNNGFGSISEIGGNWGGVSMGPFALCGNYSETDKEWFEYTRRHEFGHSIQNCVCGPLWIFIVAIPSAIRYWYFRLTPNKKHKDYNDIWFEKTATNWGTKWVDYIELS